MTKKFFYAELSGTPYEIGFSHGSKAKKYILHNISIYQQLFMNNAGVKWDDAKSASRRYIPYISSYDPDLLDEMRGIADGAGLDFEDILALNARSEVLMTLTPKDDITPVDGCTNIAVMPDRSRNGHTYLAHNWDWKIESRESIITLKIKQSDKPDILMITEAGIVGKFGVNSSGIGVAMNALSTPCDAEGVPLHCILRGVLNSRTLTQAVYAITHKRCACAANYMMASAGGEIFDCERVPDDFEIFYPSDGLLHHTNTILSQKLKNKYPDNMHLMGASTFLRYYRSGRLIRKFDRIGPDELKSVLADHGDAPDSVCSHDHAPRYPDETVFCTIFTILIDLESKTMEICAENPCEGEFYTLSL